jgi:hypothetical protein
LPEGTRVRVEPVSIAVASVAPNESVLARLGEFVGAVGDLPEDLAENHDHYLYGAPKRQ